jgi:hypothetical protein
MSGAKPPLSLLKVKKPDNNVAARALTSIKLFGIALNKSVYFF